MAKLILLDRDGVLNKDRPDSVKNPDEFIMLPGAATAVARLNKSGLKVAIVTNQSIVGKGIITQAMLDQIHDKLRDELKTAGAWVDDIFVAPDAGDAPSTRRKPAAGMLLEALEKYKADPINTPFVGDALRDLEAAALAGCPRILVRTGKGKKTEKEGFPPSLLPVQTYNNISEAVDAILEKKRN